MTYHHEQAVKAIQTQAHRASELAESLVRYAEQMTDDREIKPGTRMEWAINEIENYIRNVNFAALARVRSEINS